MKKVSSKWTKYRGYDLYTILYGNWAEGIYTFYPFLQTSPSSDSLLNIERTLISAHHKFVYIYMYPSRSIIDVVHQLKTFQAEKSYFEAFKIKFKGEQLNYEHQNPEQLTLVDLTVAFRLRIVYIDPFLLLIHSWTPKQVLKPA